MAQGGATNPADSDQFIENIVKYIREKPDLVSKLEDLLKLHGFNKEGEVFNESAIKHVSELLMKDKDLLKGAIDIVKEYLEKDNNELKMLLEQVNKVKGMEGKLEALGNQLLTQGVIGGAAITALTGALAGSLAIGGVAGALMGGGLALAGLVALVAIVAIGYTMYQSRSEIKEGGLDVGKAIKSFMKDLIDKLPTIQKRENNFGRLHAELSKSIIGASGSEKEGKVKSARDKAMVIEMLQNEGQRSAIKELIKDGTIQNFSEDEIKRLIEKGISTHETDKEALEGLMGEFQSAITKDDKTVESFVQVVDDKVKEMRQPGSQVGDTSLEKVDKKEIEKL